MPESGSIHVSEFNKAVVIQVKASHTLSGERRTVYLTTTDAHSMLI